MTVAAGGAGVGVGEGGAGIGEVGTGVGSVRPGSPRSPVTPGVPDAPGGAGIFGELASRPQAVNSRIERVDISTMAESFFNICLKRFAEIMGCSLVLGAASS